MPEPIPSCFRPILAGAPPASTAGGPSLTTTIYDTHLGLASLTWSRTALGLSLRADLPLADNGDSAAAFFFTIRPWFFWKRKGTRRFHLDRTIDVAWDLARARFPSAGGPEPSSNFYVAVAVDAEILLLAGDMQEEAHRKLKPKRRTTTVTTPISRRDHVLLKPDAAGRRSYRAAARVYGREHEIGIEIGGREKEGSGLCVSVDGTRVLQVRRIRWKFRGRERVEIGGGGCGVERMQISWDLHRWVFGGKDGGEKFGEGVFFFRFEGEEKGYFGENGSWSGSWSWSELRKKKKSLMKTSSSSSSSSASSAGSWAVMDWASPEDAELRGGDGFTLVVCAWKS